MCDLPYLELMMSISWLFSISVLLFISIDAFETSSEHCLLMGELWHIIWTEGQKYSSTSTDRLRAKSTKQLCDEEEAGQRSMETVFPALPFLDVGFPMLKPLLATEILWSNTYLGTWVTGLIMHPNLQDVYARNALSYALEYKHRQWVNK